MASSARRGTQRSTTSRGSRRRCSAFATVGLAERTRAAGHDHDVRRGEQGVDLVEAHGAAVRQLGGELLAALERAVGDDEAACSPARPARGAVCAAISPAPITRTSRSPSRPKMRWVTVAAALPWLMPPDAMRVSVRTRLPARSAPRARRSRRRPAVPACERDLVRLAELPLDLGLAEDGGLEPGRHAEGVTGRGLALAQPVDGAVGHRARPGSRLASASTASSPPSGMRLTT